jgi:predicted homoserine dehydrogenase-like protein
VILPLSDLEKLFSQEWDELPQKVAMVPDRRDESRRFLQSSIPGTKAAIEQLAIAEAIGISAFAKTGNSQKMG